MTHHEVTERCQIAAWAGTQAVRLTPSHDSDHFWPGQEDALAGEIVDFITQTEST